MDSITGSIIGCGNSTVSIHHLRETEHTVSNIICSLLHFCVEEGSVLPPTQSTVTHCTEKIHN